MTGECLAPSCPNGMAEFNIFIEGVWLTCHFEYEPYQRATENEPGWRVLLVLQAAYHHGVDIMPLMQESIMVEIENLALLELENQDDF
jgi:hypothetical protein